MPANFEPKSIQQHIEALARLTGAPGPFIEQVKELFCKKGIPLDSDATPYLKALDEAFLREAQIRSSADEARQRLMGVRRSIDSLGKSYTRQVSELRSLRKRVRKSRRDGQAEELSLAPDDGSTVRLDHRSLVTRREMELPPIVPGPEEIQ